MSRRSYSKSADRSHHTTTRGAGLDPATVNVPAYLKLKVRRPAAKWFYIFKDGVRLAFNKDRTAAFTHASRIGGEVRQWDPASKSFVVATKLNAIAALHAFSGGAA